MEYTQPLIKGKAAKTILSEKTALVLEGGGIRGFYSAGVFDAFMNAGILFPYIIGVSAGAANVLSYVAGQQGRTRQVAEFYAGDPRYVSKRNLIFHRSLFNMKFIFQDVPQKHVFFDWEMFNLQNIRLLTGALDCKTGQTVWFEKQDIVPPFQATVASCSIPLLSRIVHYKGCDLLDGGIADPIPIEKSISDGNTFHVVVLTRNEAYKKEEFKYKRLIKLFYRKYPKLIEAMLNRHNYYNRQLELCEKLEQEGKAIIIRPQKKLQIESTAADKKQLLALYDEGYEEGAAKLDGIKKFCNM